jgi:CheY-like chemotaxis protein
MTITATPAPFAPSPTWIDLLADGCRAVNAALETIYWTLDLHLGFTFSKGIDWPALCSCYKRSRGFLDLAPDLTEQQLREEERSGVVDSSKGEMRSQPATRASAPTPLPIQLNPRAGSKAAVLIVDDEFFMRDVASRALRAAGYQIRTAADGREAVELLRSDPAGVQLVLLDLLMPKQDGWTTLQALRAIRSDIPVLLTSGQCEEEMRGRCQEVQARGFLAKPYTLETLTRTVERALRGEAT